MNARLIAFIIGTLLIIMTGLMLGYKAVQVARHYQDQNATAYDKLDEEIGRHKK